MRFLILKHPEVSIYIFSLFLIRGKSLLPLNTMIENQYKETTDENYQNLQNTQQQNSRPLFIQQKANQSNEIGIAGFVLSVIAIFVGWIPFLGWFVWLLGLVLSFIGIFKAPKGFAIAGLIISLLGIVLLIFLFGAIFALIGLSQ